jgi:hypothetical protein
MIQGLLLPAWYAECGLGAGRSLPDFIHPQLHSFLTLSILNFIPPQLHHTPSDIYIPIL